LLILVIPCEAPKKERWSMPRTKGNEEEENEERK
jgi:hypothetical protein